MANSEYTIKVKVQGGTDVEGLKRALDGLGATVVKTRNRVKDADKNSADFFDTQKKGIIGTANSTKSFSKLAETIGSGGGGVVGAYATLAANIYAVTAAFNALRNAAQVEQLLRGLEEAGTRTGRSLTTTANALRDVTGAAISTEEAMRATAQITSAGFDSKTVERLGQAARDTSFALGRNMTDSLDRLSRGIVKLEPELLDELGIMTKLTESNIAYARELGKTESQLTNFEKRQGFANAVLTEAELKFGGISKAAGDAQVYDQLGATFKDLSTTVFNAINIIGKPLAGMMNSMTTLLGVALLFGSTLKSQLLPPLANMAVNAKKAAEGLRDQAKQQLDNVTTAKKAATAQRELALENKKNFDHLGSSAPAVYARYKDAVKNGTATVVEQEKALNSLAAAERQHLAQLTNNKKYIANTPEAEIASVDKAGKILAIQAERKALEELIEDRKKAATEGVNGEASVIAARRASNIATLQARSQESLAASLGAASTLNMRAAFTQLALSVESYNRALKYTAASTAALAGGTVGSLAKMKIAWQTLTFSAVSGIKVIGTTILTVLPYLGLITMAIGLAVEAYNSFKSDATKQLEKATEELAEVTKKASEYGKELARIHESQATASQRTAAAITLQSNAMTESREKFDAYVASYMNARKSGFFDFDFSTKEGKDEIAGWWDRFDKRGNLSYHNNLKMTSKTLGLADRLSSDSGPYAVVRGDENKQAVAIFNQMEQVNKKGLDQVMKTRGGYEAFFKTLDKDNPAKTLLEIQKVMAEVEEKTSGAAESVKQFQEAFKELDNQIADFVRSSIPTTPYDQLAKSLVSANKAAQELRATTDPRQFTALLSGLSGTTTRALNIDTQLDVEAYNEAASVAQRLKALRKELEDKGEKLNATDDLRLRQANAVLATETQLGQRIASEIEQRQTLVQQAQESERLNKSQLTLLNAQMQANNRIYTAGAAGMAARLNAEERSRKIQVQNLENQIKVTEAMAGSLKATISGLEAEKLNISLHREKLEAIKQENLERLQTLKIQAESMLLERNISTDEALERTKDRRIPMWGLVAGEERDTALIINAYRDIKTGLDKTVDTKALIAEDTAKEAALTSRIAATQLELKDTMQGISALRTQIAAINEADLTTEQKRAILINAQRDFNAGLLNSINDQLKSLGEINDIYAETDARLAGISDRLDYQISRIKVRAEEERKALKRTTEDTQGKTLAEIGIAQADLDRARARSDKDAIFAAEAQVTAAQNTLAASQSEYNIALQRIDATETQAIVEKTVFNTRKEGLEWQKDSLESLLKVIEAERTVGDELEKQASLRQAITAKRAGYQVSEFGQQAREIKVAQQAYEFAVAEVEIRHAMVDLEYGLLEAQRDNVAAELEARKVAGKLSAAQVQQIDTVLNRIMRVDFTAAADNAHKSLELGVQNKFNEMQLARIPETSNPFGDIMSAVTGASERIAAMRETRNMKHQVRVAEDVAIDKTPPKKLEDLPKNPLIQANEVLAASLNGLRSVIEAWLKSNPLQTVDASESFAAGPRTGSAGAGASANARTALNFFMSKGLSPEQAAGIVGNLQQESGKNLDPASRNKKSGMEGIAQWDSARRKRFASKNGGVSPMHASLEKQLEYIYWEMTQDPYENKKLKEAGFFKKGGTARQYATSFDDGFERSGRDQIGKRIANAETLVRTISPAEKAAEAAAVITVDAAKEAAKSFTEGMPTLPKFSDHVPAVPAPTVNVEPPVVKVAETKAPVVLPAIAPTPVSITPPPLAAANDNGGVKGAGTDAKKSAASVVSLQDKIAETRVYITTFMELTAKARESMAELGPQGVAVSNMVLGLSTVSSSALSTLQTFAESKDNIAKMMSGENPLSKAAAHAKDTADKVTAVAGVMSSAFSAVQSITTAMSDAKIANIDREIAAEQKRDGKSAESVAKLAALEKKKDAVARKQFNLNKKIQMAQAVVATAAGVAQALTLGPIVGPIMAGIVGAMGAAQIAIIAGTSYQSSATTAPQVDTPSTLSIGKRGDTIDLAKQNTNVGGEIGYLRGAKGTGRNSSNYSVVGSAYGGELPRGYGNTAYVVGEKGPETITPETNITVRPANESGSSASPISASITINALDASGVEDILQNQKGNLISMLREAANANGQPFMESVNTNSYSRPNKTGNSRL